MGITATDVWFDILLVVASKIPSHGRPGLKAIEFLDCSATKMEVVLCNAVEQK